MEIERKWMVTGWPQAEYPLLSEQRMRQGYVSVSPTVRIREEAMKDGETEYILCFKSRGGLARKEIEMAVPKDKFLELEDLIGRPLIPKVRRTFLLPDGLKLEVNHVDEGLPTEFWYAEIEYGSIREAKNWRPADDYLETFLSDEVTLDPSQTMGAYWVKTRLQKN